MSRDADCPDTHNLDHGIYDDDCPCCQRESAIEAEARAAQDAELLRLREALERLYQHVNHTQPKDEAYWNQDAFIAAGRALTDSAPAAREIEQRIAAEAVKPWREALTWALDTLALVDFEEEMSAPWENDYDKARTLLKASESTPEGEP